MKENEKAASAVADEKKEQQAADKADVQADRGSENTQEVMAESTETGEENKVKIMKEALADYVLARMPQDMADSFYSGMPVGEIVSAWENSQLKKENRQLKQKLEQATDRPLTLAGQGGEREKDPFALGFMQAMESY